MRPMFGAVGMLMLALCNGTRADVPAPAGLELVEVKRIWDAAPHNAFTDLIRFQDRWYCAFREGQDHVSPDGKLRVLVSQDGETWKSAALLSHDAGDARDAKLSITLDGRLMLSGAVRYDQPVEGHTFKSLTWFSTDGANWTKSQEIGEPDVWIWSVTWRGDSAYGVGYSTLPSVDPKNEQQFARLYQTQDGLNWTTLVPNLFPPGGYPNETSLVFAKDKTCYCLLRRETDDQAGQLGIANPPYKEWQWHDVGVRIGGPKMIQLPDGRLLAAARLYFGGKPHTSLCWIEAQSGALTEALRLPSGGDTSYAGMVLHNGLVWISYYSSHEDKTSIYLAKAKISKNEKQ